MAPRAGLEPATDRLTADCSTAELPGNARYGLNSQQPRFPGCLAYDTTIDLAENP